MSEIKGIFLAVFIVSIGFFSPIAAAEKLPAVQPDGWVTGEIKGELDTYLQSHYVYAKEKGLTPYVYIYSDHSRHCKSIRGLMKRDDMKAAFSGIYIVMLNYSELVELDKERPKRKRLFISGFSPVIAQVSEEGKLFGKVMNPELYLFYPLATNERELRKYSVRNKRGAPVPNSVFAKYLKKYFEANGAL